MCGDESTDMHWYSKRAALSGVYGAQVFCFVLCVYVCACVCVFFVDAAAASSELFMLSDTDPSKQETWRFLNERLDNYAAVIQVRASRLRRTDVATLTQHAQTTSAFSKLLRRD